MPDELTPGPAAAGVRESAGRPRPLRVRTPAKVNLSLLVGPPAADGYHPLFTVFVPIDLHDELEFRLTAVPPSPGASLAAGGPTPPGGRRRELQVECPGVPPDANLISRALGRLTHETGWTFRGSVRVQKNIPTGAGLGGGSSNAACALRVGADLLAAAGGPTVGPVELARMAHGLGADVPFFLDPRPSVARGVGEQLSPLALPALPLVLVLPEEELSTAEAYRTYDGVAGSEAATAFEVRCRMAEQSWRTLEQAWRRRELTLADFCVQVASLMQNDLERASLHLLPDLAPRLAAIRRRGALAALMSGSGPTLFGLCASHDEAGSVAAGLARDGARARVTWSADGAPDRHV